MKVSIIGSAGIPAVYGGFETLAENLVKYQSDWIEYTVFCSSKLYKEKRKSFLKAKLVYINLNANGIFSILYDCIAMIKSLHSDVMLILGVSGSILLPFIKLFYKGRIIVNIDGIEWKREKWSWYAKLLLLISEKTAMIFSDTIIGDNFGIIHYIDEKYSRSAELIEYGADHVFIPKDKGSSFAFLNRQYAVTVCRIEPENNIHKILKAFECIDKYCLVVIGNWKNSIYGLSLYKAYSHDFPNIYLIDPIYDQNKINLIRANAKIYIHGHSAGGTNPSLVEAMYLGLPVLAYDCVYNRSTTNDQCLYWINSGDLELIINNMTDEILQDNKIKMQEIASYRYTWNTIREKYENLYLKPRNYK